MLYNEENNSVAKNFQKVEDLVFICDCVISSTEFDGKFQEARLEDAFLNESCIRQARKDLKLVEASRPKTGEG